MLQDMGFLSALIQRNRDLEAAISVTWYANVAGRLAFYALLFFTAPLVAACFPLAEKGELIAVLRVASLGVVIGALGSVNQALLRKRFQFKRLLVVDSGEVLTLAGVQIGLACLHKYHIVDLGHAVWSLVYGHLAAMVVRTIILWWVLPIRIGRFDVRVAKEMFHFGMHMSFSTVGLWLIKNLDRLFVGRYMGQTALGYYTLAFTLSNMIAVNVARMLGTVLFPAFAEIGHDYDRVRGAWLQAVRYSMVGIVPLGAAVITFAPEILLTFFPQRTIVTVPLAILTVCAVARGVGVPLGDLAKGIGKPAILTRVAFWHVVVLAPLLFVVTSDVFSARTVLMVASLAVSGSSSLAVLIAVSLVVSGSTIFAISLSLFLTSREVKFTARQVIGALRPSATSGLAMVGSGWVAKKAFFALVPGAPAVLVLLVAGTLSLCVYGLSLRLLFPSVAAELLRLAKGRRGEKQQKVPGPVPSP
jgi:O-antigen/teichoic acid export membrane protein